MVENTVLIIYSFFASLGFGIVFRIEKNSLCFAGLGGALTRCAYLLFLSITDKTLIYSLFAAMAAALYAECMATWKKVPSTLFLYPSIIPLVPGELLYNTVVNFILQDAPKMLYNARECAVRLAGISVGFVLVSTFTYHKRVYYLGINFVNHLFRRPDKKT